MRPRGDPEDRALRRARWAITAQISVVVSLLVAVAGAIAYGILLAGQHADADRVLARTIQLGPAETPPGCVWLFTPVLHAPAGPPPAGMPLASLAATVPSPGDVHTERRPIGAMTYTIRVENRGGVVSQAYFEEVYQIQDRSSLVFGLGVAEVLALLAAVLCGRVMAGRAIRPLADALRRQRTFVADASHELRAPLTRLHTRAQLLARRASGRDADDLEQLVRGTRELGEVVEDLLMSAQAGDRTSLELVDLGSLAEEAVAAETDRAGQGQVRLAVTRERRPYVVQGVPTALRRVLSALLDNALGHTPPGGSIEVWLGVPDDRHVELRVRDTGVGFPAAEADRIFERFARGSDGDGRRFGLGLALVREVVNGHGGTIAAAGQPGAGATFTLTLLRADAVSGGV
ncbi:HAMP domain-containing histidine kinase [Amycolatopsis sp. FBCC-B4732]|uniref:sensor histidine kinase n=1 Tax=Amycolatopsis sp. FBCC-B4732 TaxID=3079339 RepID=UPI001FF5D4EA|nr:HAMP domain-containing sensor histidine kinase [Amycolatopsis sp. FBCC-B4732]UOX86411.1 HAMP domain-containing histidine kinase [Amycolatopsis sp. FBCC-B4732]